MRQLSLILPVIAVVPLTGCFPAVESSEFPTELKMAIIEGGVFDFDAQAPHIKTACLIHEYRTAESVTEKFGIEGVPSLYVAELRDLFLLETRDGGFEYLEIDHRQYLITPDQPFYKCYHSENLIWDFVRLDTSKDGPPETLEITGTLMQRTDL